MVMLWWAAVSRVLGFLHLPFVWVLWFPLVLLAFLGVVLFQSLRSRYAFSVEIWFMSTSYDLLAHCPHSLYSLHPVGNTNRAYLATDARRVFGWLAGKESGSSVLPSHFSSAKND
jgi:hypothetical protein